MRLVQMMGLYSIDKDDFNVQKFLPPTKDIIDLEERRRTFWAAYYGDRVASVGSGLPMMIHESEVSSTFLYSKNTNERDLHKLTQLRGRL